MSSEPCPRCGGDGQDGFLGSGAYGPVFAGVCHSCGGTGFIRVAPRSARDPFAYLSPAERDQLDRDNARSRAERDAEYEFLSVAYDY